MFWNWNSICITEKVLKLLNLTLCNKFSTFHELICLTDISVWFSIWSCSFMLSGPINTLSIFVLLRLRVDKLEQHCNIHTTSNCSAPSLKTTFVCIFPSFIRNLSIIRDVASCCNIVTAVKSKVNHKPIS